MNSESSLVRPFNTKASPNSLRYICQESKKILP